MKCILQVTTRNKYIFDGNLIYAPQNDSKIVFKMVCL